MLRGTTLARSGLALALMAAACGGKGAPADQPAAVAEAAPAKPPSFTLAGAEHATNTEPAPPALPEPRIVRVTVVSGEVAPHMRNGEHWDVAGRAPAGGGNAALNRYLGQHPELTDTRGTVGIPVHADELDKQVETNPAADPMVFVEVGERIFRSPLRMRALNPVWDFRFEFLYGDGAGSGAAGDTLVRINVVDFDGPAAYETIGSTVLTVAELLDSRVHRLEAFGSVEGLTLQVDTRPVPEAPEPRVERLAVPGQPSWTSTAIELVAGQRVRIEAADEVCTKGDQARHCSGPEGQSRASGANLAGFRDLGHGTLVGAVGDVRFAVGRSLELTVPSSGRLLLGVNDRDTGNNRGSYAVRIIVHPIPD